MSKTKEELAPEILVFDELKDVLKTECYQLNKPGGCQQLADIYHSIDKNFNESKRIYQENCEQRKYSPSCFNLANYYFTGRTGTKKDYAKAFEYFQKGCELGSPESCNNAGMMLQRGLGVSKDIKEAESKFSKACEWGFKNGCYNLSCLHLSGR
eukprot:Colp12_sorted_trinity150504_noHs@26467